MNDKTIKSWSPLDNAAKIFPPSSSGRDTKVFRFACELYEDVEPAILQEALDRTMEAFPIYRSVLRKGFFWYYFEESELPTEVAEESGSPCSAIYDRNRLGLLFEVSYYKKRINLEVFHALADGAGASKFLRTLVFAYLTLKYPEKLGELPDDCDASFEQKRLDAFQKYYEKEKKILPNKTQRAYRIHGQQLPDNLLGVIEGTLSASAVLEKAHEKNVTMSEFLTALLLISIYDGMAVRDRSRPVVITLPVDLRRYFPTQTARNFFGVIKVSHCFAQDGEGFDEVIAGVRRSFREQLTQENMLGIINRYSALENNLLIRAIPLWIKVPALKLAVWQSHGMDTAAISNVGKVVMPPEVSPYIRLFSVCLSTIRPQICVCSYGDRLSLSFSSPLASTDVQRCFYRRLAEMGIAIEIVSNLVEEQKPKEDADHAVL